MDSFSRLQAVMIGSEILELLGVQFEGSKIHLRHGMEIKL